MSATKVPLRVIEIDDARYLHINDCVALLRALAQAAGAEVDVQTWINNVANHLLKVVAATQTRDLP